MLIHCTRSFKQMFFFSSRDIPERLKGKVYAGGVLAVLLYGCESWCLTASRQSRCGGWLTGTTSGYTRCAASPCYRPTSTASPPRASRSVPGSSRSSTLLWAGHVARMHKGRLPKRLMLSWIPEPRVAGGQEMTYGRSLQRHLAHFNLPAAFTE